MPAILWATLLMTVPVSALADGFYFSPGGRQILRVEYKNKPRLFLYDGRDTELEITGLGLKWCDTSGCKTFAPRSDQALPSTASETHILLTDPQGATLELLLSDQRLAFRFAITSKLPFEVVAEDLAFHVPELRWSKGASKVCGPVVPDCFHDSHEYVYQTPIDLSSNRLVFLPVMLQGKGSKLMVGEMNVRRHAGAYLSVDPDLSFRLAFPNYPKQVKAPVSLDVTEEVMTREKFIAAYSAGRTELPWRFVFRVERDLDLLRDDLLDGLADPPSVDPAAPWIERGFGTEEWITGAKIDLPEAELGFTPGINTATYKYYIDFAHRFGLKYVILDDGWSDGKDIYKTNPAIDLAELKRHAAANRVRLVLWVKAATLKSGDLEAKLAYLRALGASALKVDFFNRDDAAMNRFQERLYRAAYDHELMLILHGVAKPTGQDTTWPHVMSWEGGMGHEYNKWSANLTPAQKLSTLMMRGTLGAFDYEGAGFRNRLPDEFLPEDANPFSQGTRAAEIAYYVMLNSKIQILAGNLADYVRAPAHTQFLTAIPTAWDETIPLLGQVDRLGVMARRAGRVWYIAGLNASDFARTVTVNLRTWMGAGRYAVTRLEDCASGVAICANLSSSIVDSKDDLKLEMNAFGGIVLRLDPLDGLGE